MCPSRGARDPALVVLFRNPIPDLKVTLDLALVGNGSIGALIDAHGSVAWCCFPRFDGDPAFCSLLAGDSPRDEIGTFTIELQDGVKTEQQYIPDTPIL